MKINTRTIKEYSQTYYVAGGYNGMQFGKSITEEQARENCFENAKTEAHDRFISDTNRYSRLPMPRWKFCKFENIKTEIKIVKGNYIEYIARVKVSYFVIDNECAEL